MSCNPEKPESFPRMLKLRIRSLFKASKLPAEDITNAINSIYTPSFRKLGLSVERIGDVDTLSPRESKGLMHKLLQYCREHPVKVTFIVLAVIVACCAPVITPIVLQSLGFTASGPLAGSLAASFQSAFGVNMIFSALQSAAMGGYAAPAVTAVVGAAIPLTYAAVAAGPKIAGYAVTAVHQTVKIAQAATRALVELGSKIWKMLASFMF